MLNKLTNRTRDALANKINEMGYSCKNGYMVGKIKCLMNTQMYHMNIIVPTILLAKNQKN